MIGSQEDGDRPSHRPNVAVHRGDLLWTPSPRMRMLELGSKKQWPAENSCLHGSTTYKDELSSVVGLDPLPLPWPSPLTSFFIALARSSCRPQIPTTDSGHRSFVNPAPPHSQSWHHLQLSPSPADALINLSCFTNLACVFLPRQTLRFLSNFWMKMISSFSTTVSLCVESPYGL